MPGILVMHSLSQLLILIASGYKMARNISQDPPYNFLLILGCFKIRPFSVSSDRSVDKVCLL